MWNPKEFGFEEFTSHKLSRNGFILKGTTETRYLFTYVDEEIWRVYNVFDSSKGKNETMMANYTLKYEGKLPSNKFAKKIFNKGLNILIND